MTGIHTTYTGPLAVPAQIAAEQRALRLFAHPDIKALRSQLAKALHNLPAAQIPDGRATIAASIAQWTMTLIMWELNGDTARPALLWSVEDSPHAWFGHVMPGMAAAGDNPDHIYRNAFLDGASSYRVTGRLPANPPAQFSMEIYRGSPGQTAITAQTAKTPDLGNQVSLIMSGDMTFTPDGAFTVSIGAAPGPDPANHLALAPGAMTLAVRDVLSDWQQSPTTLAITRTAGPPGDPRTDTLVIERVVESLPGFVRFWAGFNTHWLGGLPTNAATSPVARDGGWGYLAAGRFDLANHEALLIETTDAGAPYTGLQVVNPWMVMHSSAAAATVSLNSAQAARNPDGSLTYLLARRDPGIANWLDTGGLAQGIFILRWQAVPAAADPANMLTSLRKIRLDASPPELPRLSPAARKAQLQTRRAQFALRLGTPN